MSQPGALLLALAAVAWLTGCQSPPPSSIIVTEGVCWPGEGPAAFREYQSNCGADGTACPATTEWRGRLSVLKALIPPCGAASLGDQPTEVPDGSASRVD